MAPHIGTANYRMDGNPTGRLSILTFSHQPTRLLRMAAGGTGELKMPTTHTPADAPPTTEVGGPAPEAPGIRNLEKPCLRSTYGQPTERLRAAYGQPTGSLRPSARGPRLHLHAAYAAAPLPTRPLQPHHPHAGCSPTTHTPAAGA